MSEPDVHVHTHKLESRIATLKELLGALERTVVEQSERFERAEREQARLAAIVESSDDAITSVSTDFRITSWNRAAERLFGISAGEAIGQPLEMTIPPQFRELARKNMKEDLALLHERRDFVHHLETTVVNKDGTAVDVSLVVSGIYDRAGNVLGMSQIFHDITERKRAEREQALFAALVKSSEDGIISVGVDGMISSWNAAAEKLFGFTAVEAIGQASLTWSFPPNCASMQDPECCASLPPLPKGIRCLCATPRSRR
jgi:PAS domain S-box-containing protein